MNRWGLRNSHHGDEFWLLELDQNLMGQKVGNAPVDAPSTMSRGQRHECEPLLWRIPNNLEKNDTVKDVLRAQSDTNLWL